MKLMALCLSACLSTASYGDMVTKEYDDWTFNYFKSSGRTTISITGFDVYAKEQATPKDGNRITFHCQVDGNSVSKYVETYSKIIQGIKDRVYVQYTFDNNSTFEWVDIRSDYRKGTTSPIYPTVLDLYRNSDYVSIKVMSSHTEIKKDKFTVSLRGFNDAYVEMNNHCKSN